MKLTLARTPRPAGFSWQGQRAFTLSEILVSMVLFMLVLGGLVACQLYGLRMCQITNPKLDSSEQARDALNHLMGDIRTARLIRIGTGSLTSFAEFGLDQPQRGNAIQVYLSLNTNNYVRYYLDGTDNKLKRTTNGTAAVEVLANAVTNSTIFTSEDFAGNVLTNNHDNRIIGLKLEFYQIQYPRMAVGSGQYYDYYQLHTRVTRRTIL
jgi:hypothetical protein